MTAVSLPRRRILGAIVWRDYLTKRSYRLAFAMDVFNGALTLAIYFFISRFIVQPNLAELNDAPSYFAFATCGILVAGMITSGSVELVTRLREEQLGGTLETLAGNPVSTGELCLGLVGFPFSFAVARALVYFVVVSAVIGLDLRQASWIGLIVVLFVTAAVFAGIAIAAAAAVLVFKRADVFVGLDHRRARRLQRIGFPPLEPSRVASADRSAYFRRMSLSTVSATRSSAARAGRSMPSRFLRSPRSSSRWGQLSSGSDFAPRDAPARSASISPPCRKQLAWRTARQSRT